MSKGAANVWASVQLDSPDPADSHSPWMSRAALLVWTVAVGVLGLMAITADEANESGPAQPDEAPVVSSEPLPEPILVDGMQLARVTRPFDPDFDGDDIFDDLGIVRSESNVFLNEDPPQSTVIFAKPVDPFNGPIVGLHLSNGGFRPWSANVSQGELDGYLDQLIRSGGEWTMPSESDLVEVARFTNGLHDNLKFGWQFDFMSGNSEVTLQAETSNNQATLSEWLWVARLVREGDVGTLVSEVKVLGQAGIRIQPNDESVDPQAPTNQVVWRSKDFVYRMTAATVEDNTSSSGEATAEVSRLQVADRGTWVEAINAAGQPPVSELIVVILAGLIFIGLAASVAVFGAKREYKTAAALLGLVALVLAGGLGVLSSATPIWLLTVGVLGLGVILWHQNPTRERRGL